MSGGKDPPCIRATVLKDIMDCRVKPGNDNRAAVTGPREPSPERPAGSQRPKDNRNKQQHENDKENDFRRRERCTGNAAKPEDGGDQTDNEKSHNQVHHGLPRRVL